MLNNRKLKLSKESHQLVNKVADFSAIDTKQWEAENQKLTFIDIMQIEDVANIVSSHLTDKNDSSGKNDYAALRGVSRDMYGSINANYRTIYGDKACQDTFYCANRLAQHGGSLSGNPEGVGGNSNNGSMACAAAGALIAAPVAGCMGFFYGAAKDICGVRRYQGNQISFLRPSKARELKSDSPVRQTMR